MVYNVVVDGLSNVSYFCPFLQRRHGYRLNSPILQNVIVGGDLDILISCLSTIWVEVKLKLSIQITCFVNQ